MKNKIMITEDKQIAYEKLAKRYKEYKAKNWKCKVRNELYVELKPWMLIWMKSILSSWHKWEEEDALLSLSWDAFCFCLEYYKVDGIRIPQHFFMYTKYFLLKEYAKKDLVELEIEELKDTLSIVPTEMNNTFIDLLTINQYAQSNVSPDHKEIFYDALHSMSENHMERVWGWKSGCGISQKTYNELKKAYNGIILWILKK